MSGAESEFTLEDDATPSVLLPDDFGPGIHESLWEEVLV